MSMVSNISHNHSSNDTAKIAKIDSHDTAERPSVHFIAVTLLGKNLWGDVVGCAAQCPATVTLFQFT